MKFYYYHVLTLFLTHVLNMPSGFNRLEQNKSYRKDVIGSFCNKWNPKSHIIHFLLKIYKGLKFPFVSLLIVGFHVLQWMREISCLLYIWLEYLVYPYHWFMIFSLRKTLLKVPVHSRYVSILIYIVGPWAKIP